MKEKDLQSIKKYVRAADYLVASQLYLQSNFLLQNKFTQDDVKPRLLGHWGTCPGINFVYAQLNYLIKKHDLEMLFVLGPGHGFPALQANLFLEGTLEKFYPKATRDEEGIAYLSRSFSWPYGFPSHSNPGTPGVILEGGELGYSLSTSYGAVLDNPNLIVACLVGDGEAETGPLATAWHLNKFVSPRSSGAVLPILHLNGYKISGPTIFGRMSDKELLSLFYGYGYDPVIVEGESDPIYQKMAETLEASYKKITAIQKQARKNKEIVSPRWPMIILRTPKGWTGIKELKGEKIEGNCLAHQVIAKEAKTDKKEFKALEAWLRSYKFEELFDGQTFSKEMLSILPREELRMGMSPHALAKNSRDLILPKTDDLMEKVPQPGKKNASSMEKAGVYLKEVMKRNAITKNFRFFSPDETYSNKLDAIFKATSRSFVWPRKPWDKDLADDGRVIEMLSEHSLQGLLQGYVLTGRHALFASYEAFVEIVSSMVDQYAKFLRVAREEIPWRNEVPSLNYILTSSGWRQEHNGFSHQNPAFISSMLEKQGCFVRVYFPPDANTTLEVLKASLATKNEIHVIVAGKTPEPLWLTPAQARKELMRGLMVWDFASDENPDVVFAGIGDYMTKESLAAIDILKTKLPHVRVRFVNITELTALGIGDETCRVSLLDSDDFFTHDKPVIMNFYGHPEALQPMVVAQKHPGRFRVHGYIEHGSTTTPFDMQVRNRTSRYHLAIEAVQLLAEKCVIMKSQADELQAEWQKVLTDHQAYIREYGIDPPEINNWTWKRNT